MSYSSASGDFDMAVAGDCMLTRRLSIYDEPQFLALRKYFTDCDAGFVNLESVVRHWNEGTPGITRGTFMTTPPELLADLKWFGVNIVSCANNHAFDYGEGGLVATMQHLDRHGIARAGSGHNLAEARMPGYLETRGGRVALLATTSTYRDWNRAGAQRPDLRGRPGVNPFSSSTKTVLDAEAFDAMKRMSRELGFEQARARDRTHFYSEKESPPDRAEELLIFGQHFVKGDHFTMSSAGDPDDIADHLRWIREARRQADWVVMSFHTHDFAHGSFAKAKTKIDLQEPAEYVRDFAYAAIDAGADMFVGHGSHTPLGIEFYKGKPIFYSVGNMFFQNETVPFFPDEAYTRFGLGYDATPADFLDTRTGGGSKGHIAHAGFWENIAATCHFRGGKLDHIKIIPIEQGHGLSRAQRGRPVLAGGKTAASIIERVASLSAPYGVKVEQSGDIGVVRPT